MASSSRDRISVDLRGLKAALVTRAREQGVSPSEFVRSSVAEALGPTGAEHATGTAPATDAGKRVRLSLRMRRVDAEAAERFTKSLWTDRSAGARPCLVTVADEAAQADWVADAVLREREGGMALKNQAVLFRASHHSAALELELARRNIPFFKFGGLKFLEAAHVKDVLSVLRWAQNPRSRLAGFRVAQLVPGIGPATACRLLDAWTRRQRRSTLCAASHRRWVRRTAGATWWRCSTGSVAVTTGLPTSTR
jgi:hypothetical protein